MYAFAQSETDLNPYFQDYFHITDIYLFMNHSFFPQNKHIAHHQLPE